eukprot:s2993_g11.t1
MQRYKGSMQAFLQLTALPDTKISPEEAAELDARRKAPMANESAICWAVQKGGDETTRLPLPSWVSHPLERKITEWAAENAKWKKKIQDRGGSDLPPASRRKYDDFLSVKSKVALLFNKKREKLVQRVQSQIDFKKCQKDLMSIEITMNEDPGKLQLKVGDGLPLRMVLLKGEPMEVDQLPACLAEAGISSKVAEAAAAAMENEEKSHGSEAEDGHAMEERAMNEIREAEAMEMDLADREAQDEDEEVEELLVFSGDEDDLELLDLAPTKYSRVKDFCHRESYRHLAARGLSQVPPGCMIAYHKTSRTWQGYFEGKSCGLTFTHGGRTNRTEVESLWSVLVGLAERHCEKNTRDRLWASQLANLKKGKQLFRAVSDLKPVAAPGEDMTYFDIVGAFIAMLLSVPVILFDSRHEAAFVRLVTALAAQLGLKFFFANIVEVKLVENDSTMKMHPVVTLMAVAFFGFIWGPTGMLLSVPMMTYLKAVLLVEYVPAGYRDPLLVLIEGDRLAPKRLRSRLKEATKRSEEAEWHFPIPS